MKIDIGFLMYMVSFIVVTVGYFIGERIQKRKVRAMYDAMKELADGSQKVFQYALSVYLVYALDKEKYEMIQDVNEMLLKIQQQADAMKNV